MPYDSRADLIARLAEVRAAITKARTAQSYNAGADMSVTRGLLKSLYEEEKWILSKLEAMDAASSGGPFIKTKIVNRV